jgi:cytochrome c peroxidase
MGGLVGLVGMLAAGRTLDGEELGEDRPDGGLDTATPTPTPSTLVALGNLLFRDPILSSDRDLACAPCHQPQFG